MKAWHILPLAFVLIATGVRSSPSDDRRVVAALDTAYQAAVEKNDAAAMAAIQREDMILVYGDGSLRTGEELLRDAREKRIVYERQVEDPGTQTVRIYGEHTAVVTARLWIKGMQNGKPIHFRVWFSDTYIRTPGGWRYAFGQASMPMPAK
jgi:uncharacterized protein (TIGR02246 family)